MSNKQNNPSSHRSLKDRTASFFKYFYTFLIDLKPYQKFILAFLIAILAGCICEKFTYNSEPFSIKRFIAILCLFFIPTIPFCIFKPHQAFDFIFRKRYFIGGILFIILVLGGFHGSSIYMLNNYVQPDLEVENAKPIIGQPRLIRSDEWATSTPTLLTQIPNDFAEENSIMNGYPKNVTFYPRTVVKNPISLSNPRTWGFFFLPTEQAFSFSWYIGYFTLFFATLELFMLLTRKNRPLSLCGAIMITFAPAVQWWEGWDIIAFGELAIVLFNYLLRSKKLISQLLSSLAIGIIGTGYIMCLYPAWQIPYGFFFLILAIWVIRKNLKNCSFRKFFMLFVSIFLCIGVIIVPAFIQSYNVYQLVTHTVYPGARFSTGGSGAINFFNYLGNLFMPFKDYENFNPCEVSQFISLFPIPIIMGIYYWYNNHKTHKKDFLLTALTVLSILLCIWNFIPLPSFLIKITFLSMSTPPRTLVTVTFICVVLLIHCLSNYSTKAKNDSRTKYLYLCIASLTVSLGTFVAYSNPLYIINNIHYISPKIIIFNFIFFIPIIYYCLINHPSSNKITVSILAFIILFAGISVHPFGQGLSIFYNKPLAQEIQKIENEDPDANWLILGQTQLVNNYPAVIGANSINSTNFFPNFELYKKIGLEDEEQIYNRFAHITVELSDKDSSLSKISEDFINLTLNNEDVCQIDVKYLFSRNQDLDQYDTEKVDFVKLYDEDHSAIYRAECKK